MATGVMSKLWEMADMVKVLDLVAASSGHPKSAKAAEYFGDVYECDKKPWAERQAILGTASQLFERIYHRPLPLAR